ncbi:MAG: hypothetical protein IPO36_10680 [Anaerolineales bacterium]|nr:hypothetical protein [Anaerolineales bacterium]
MTNTYGELGLHAHVRHLRRESVEKDRAMGAKLSLTVELMGLIGSETTFGELGRRICTFGSWKRSSPTSATQAWNQTFSLNGQNWHS